MSRDPDKFFSLSSQRIKENINRKKTIANDQVIMDVKDIVAECVNQFGEQVMQHKVNLLPKDFEKFAKLYLTIITQENEETTDETSNAEVLREDAKQFEALKSTPGFNETIDKMAEFLENKNQKQLSNQ